MAIDFGPIWERIKSETPLKNFIQLAEAIGSSKQTVSRKKAEDDFPVEWAFRVGQQYKINTDWIMTGKGPKRLSEAGGPCPDQDTSPKGIIEEWVDSVRRTEGERGVSRLALRLARQSEDFSRWLALDQNDEGQREEEEEQPEKNSEAA